MNRVDNVEFQFQEIKGDSNGKDYRVLLRIPMSVGWINQCQLVIEDGPYTRWVPMRFMRNEGPNVFFETYLHLDTRAVYRYYFQYNVNNQNFYINRQNTKTEIAYDEKNKMSVNYHAPSWAKDANMYHIFVDRFYRGSQEKMKEMPRREIHKNWDEPVVIGDNPHVYKHYEGEQVWNVDFYGGDLKGIEKKLDYIQSLGFDLIYLSPIVKSQSTHRYDTADYETVDPYAGTNEDLKHLCREAHKRGMHIIIDAVFNHTGDESKYFDRYGDYKTGNPKKDGAFQNPVSQYRGLYRYNDKGDHCYWWEFGTMPITNSDGDFWRKYICGKGGVIDQWFSLGIDGLRLDVADNLSDWALENIREAVNRNKKDALIIGEVWNNPMRVNRSFISSGKSMDSVMNYPLQDAAVRYFKYQDAYRLHYTIRDIQAEYPDDTIHTLMNFSSNHDISRGVTLLGKKRFDPYHKFQSLPEEYRNKMIEVLWEFQYSNDAIMKLLNGKIEMNYYQYQAFMNRLREKGLSEDTISYFRKIFTYSPFDPGQEYAKDLPDDVKKDLDYTRKFHFTKEEYEEAKKRYKAYLLFLATYPGIFSVFYGDEAGMEGLNNLMNRGTYPWGKEDQELVSYVRSLGLFRKDNPFLKEADYRLTSLTPNVVYSERVGDEKLFVAINNLDTPQTITIPEEYQGGEKVLTLGRSGKTSLDAYGGVVIHKK